MCELEVDYKKSFCCCSNLCNDDMISLGPGLKTGVKNDIFGLK